MRITTLEFGALVLSMFLLVVLLAYIMAQGLKIVMPRCNEHFSVRKRIRRLVDNETTLERNWNEKVGEHLLGRRRRSATGKEGHREMSGTSELVGIEEVRRRSGVQENGISV
jgi:hypothetical protein